ncbi:MAG: hypothetical protein RL235_772 [Chlamydiota bacterium]|jgi:hypothetical protein
MASRHDGVDANLLTTSRTRVEFMEIAGHPLTSQTNEQGEVIETYRILKEKGSMLRAFMHGALDLATGFLWEFVGTPIEGSLSRDTYMMVKVTFDTDETVQRIELL